MKAMVLELKQSEEDVRKNFQVEEEEQNEAELKEKRIQRTKRGLEILAERGARGPGPFFSLGVSYRRRQMGPGRRVGGPCPPRSRRSGSPSLRFSELPPGSVAAEMVVDPESTPYLDIANQTGRSIRIPPSERKVRTGEVSGSRFDLLSRAEVVF